MHILKQKLEREGFKVTIINENYGDRNLCFQKEEIFTNHIKEFENYVEIKIIKNDEKDGRYNFIRCRNWAEAKKFINIWFSSDKKSIRQGYF